MTDDRIAGTARNVGGKVQEGVGRATGNTSMEMRGKANQVEGSVQDLYGQAKDVADDAYRMAQKTAEQYTDNVRDFIEKKPYTAVGIALALGWLLGRTRTPY